MVSSFDPSQAEIAEEIRALAHPLKHVEDLAPVLHKLAGKRFIGIGEASHGTHEFYQWRALLTKELIESGSVKWIAVEGDWPDCWRINKWVKGLENQELDARGLLATFERWPTWMWANQEVADFISWLREVNLERSEADRIGFYGLDVYSLWDSLRRVMSWLEQNAPDALPHAHQAWQCFLPFKEDPHKYAWSTRLVPENCEAQVVRLLSEVQQSIFSMALSDDDAFDAAQNAVVAHNAESYYRAMVRGDRESWNIRDRHMSTTISTLAKNFVPGDQGIIWEHNTHIGDARATDMSGQGMVNVGEILRIREGEENVGLVGFSSHSGTVLASDSWGSEEITMELPPAIEGSHEALLHDALEGDALILIPEKLGPWSALRRGHRAVGVVYSSEREKGNYVPTIMGRRYDVLMWCDRTRALTPLHHEAQPRELEFETEPSGF
jgi:erythromycin esterase